MLPSHALTVTQMAFNHSGQRLLSVSRDRCWSVFKRKMENEEGETKESLNIFLLDRYHSVYQTSKPIKPWKKCWILFKEKFFFFYLQRVTNVMELFFLITGPLFRLVARSDKKNQHARIIWSCTWSGDDKYFATASRDKKVSTTSGLRTFDLPHPLPRPQGLLAPPPPLLTPPHRILVPNIQDVNNRFLIDTVLLSILSSNTAVVFIYP